MLRKLLSLGALVVVALAFGVGTAAAKSGPPNGNGHFNSNGFSDGRNGHWADDGFSDGRN
jgi:hypothetical protein